MFTSSLREFHESMVYDLLFLLALIGLIRTCINSTLISTFGVEISMSPVMVLPLTNDQLDRSRDAQTLILMYPDGSATTYYLSKQLCRQLVSHIPWRWQESVIVGVVGFAVQQLVLKGVERRRIVRFLENSMHR